MKVHTTAFKEQIKEMGRELDSIITYGDTVLGNEQLNAVTPSFQGGILKSVMKQLDIDSNVEIPVGTILNYKFGVKVNGEYEYINFGNYVVKEVEKQEDTMSYKITCYDKMLYSMVDYIGLSIEYPITIRDYINTICESIGLKFKNKNEEFANYNKQISNELYLSAEGTSLGYTFRDVFDELAQVTASVICINENDELEIRYINDTNDTIDEEYLKNINVNFGQKFGAINTIVLSRSANSDNVYYPQELPENPIEFKISDNQIMNGNDRADFLPDIYEKLNGLEFYINDFSSTGITYYDLYDMYSVKIGNNTYKCLMLNDEILITQGLEENIFTQLPEESETDYKHASNDDRKINQTYIIAKKNESEIEALTSRVTTVEDSAGNSYTKEETNQLIQNAQTGLTNTFIQSGGNNIFRNTGLWFENRKQTMIGTKSIEWNGDTTGKEGITDFGDEDMPYVFYKVSDEIINSPSDLIGGTVELGGVAGGTSQILTEDMIFVTDDNKVFGYGDNIAKSYICFVIKESTTEFSYPPGIYFLDLAGMLYVSSLTYKSETAIDPYEFWTGNAQKQSNYEATSRTSIVLQKGTFEQDVEVPNGNYTVSFYYKKLIELADAKVIINDIEYELTETKNTEFYTGKKNNDGEYITNPLEVSANHITIKFVSDTNNALELWDLMVNKGSEKVVWTQNENETTTDTVNISKGITITSSVDENTKFKADYDGIRITDKNNNVKTRFTDKGMDTDEAVIKNEANIVGILRQRVENQIWDSYIG